MKVIILAGGGGTRLFPLSRINFPKQFLNIDSDTSLLGDTVKRFLSVVPPEDIIIVTGEKYFFYAKAVLEELNCIGAHVISEPIPKNTTPAIALAVKYMLEIMMSKPDEVFFIAPADHVIRPNEDFAILVNRCCQMAQQGYVSTLGIVPAKAETGYGYIKTGEKLSDGFKAIKFLEKPDAGSAEMFLREGDYYWNSGMYAFQISTFLEELKKYSPKIFNVYELYDYKQLVTSFNEFDSISIDYAISEKSDKVAMIPLSIYWNDVGSWDAIFDMLQKDPQGNVKIGDCTAIDCKDTFLMSNERLITAIGLSDLIIVETDDIIMVAPKGETQKVKEIVDQLKERTEFRNRTQVFRPWGTYQILNESNQYKVKKIVVRAGKSLTLHIHNKRSEHWVVTQGIASVTLGDDDERLIHSNQSIYVPRGTKHRLFNRQDTPLEIIEVLNGEYLGEDDIYVLQEE